MEITQMRTDSESRYSAKVAIVYVDDSTRPGMSDIAADIEWRREHAKPSRKLAREVLELVKPKLKELYPHIDTNHYTISYSYYAGCSMCPCSPGFVVSAKGYRFRRQDIWVKV